MLPHLRVRVIMEYSVRSRVIINCAARTFNTLYGEHSPRIRICFFSLQFHSPCPMSTSRSKQMGFAQVSGRVKKSKIRWTAQRTHPCPADWPISWLSDFPIYSNQRWVTSTRSSRTGVGVGYSWRTWEITHHTKGRSWDDRPRTLVPSAYLSTQCIGNKFFHPSAQGFPKLSSAHAFFDRDSSQFLNL